MIPSKAAIGIALRLRGEYYLITDIVGHRIVFLHKYLAGDLRIPTCVTSYTFSELLHAYERVEVSKFDDFQTKE